MQDGIYSDHRFKIFMDHLDGLCSEARGNGFIEAYVVLSTLKGAILAGQSTRLANKCKEFASKLKEEILRKRPKRKINWEN